MKLTVSVIVAGLASFGIAWSPVPDQEPVSRDYLGPSSPAHWPTIPEVIQQPAPPVPAAVVAPVRKSRTVRVKVTACSPEDPIDIAYYKIHGYEGRKTRAVAAYAAHFKKGTKLSIPGYHNGAFVPVDSAGGSIIRRAARRGIIQIDVKFKTYQEAKQWGSRWLNVEVIDP